MAFEKIKTDSAAPLWIAPCGINCRLCMAYGREKKACPGCRGDDRDKSKSCLACRIKNCEKRAEGNFEYCFECGNFPCARVAQLDKRYRTNYGTSPIGNLIHIRSGGIEDFIEAENERWTCPGCGAVLCMHRPQCLACGYLWNPSTRIKQGSKKAFATGRTR